MNLDEMWERLAQHQHYADERGYGPEWSRMCAERTEAAAWAAARAADAVAETAETAAWAAETAAWAAAAEAAAETAWAAAEALGWIERAARRAAWGEK